MRDKKQAERKAKEAAAHVKQEKEKKFVRRHGYKPGTFPDLPKFRMPKASRPAQPRATHACPRCARTTTRPSRQR